MLHVSGTRFFAAFALLLSTIGTIRPCDAGSAVTVGEIVPPARRTLVERIDHSAWDTLLKKYVDVNGMVDYRAWKASAGDRLALRKYLQQLSSAALFKDSNRAVKLAFWINAYNALTMEGILREYPTSSIRNHTARFFGYNIWKDLQLWVGENTYSLDSIEHEILRKTGEPRIHFAIVCASIGCPKLLNEAYVVEKIDAQLTESAEAFFGDRAKFRYDANRKMIAISPILDWYGEDFGADRAAQLREVAQYLPDAAAQQLANSGTAQVTFLEYDWGLNDQANARRAARR